MSPARPVTPSDGYDGEAIGMKRCGFCKSWFDLGTENFMKIDGGPEISAQLTTTTACSASGEKSGGGKEECAYGFLGLDRIFSPPLRRNHLLLK